MVALLILAERTERKRAAWSRIKLHVGSERLNPIQKNENEIFIAVQVETENEAASNTALWITGWMP